MKLLLRAIPWLMIVLLEVRCAGTDVRAMRSASDTQSEVSGAQDAGRIPTEEDQRGVFENIERQKELNRRARMTPHEICEENKNWRRYGSYKECLSEVKAEKRHQQMMNAIQMQQTREDLREQRALEMQLMQQKHQSEKDSIKGYGKAMETMIDAVGGQPRKP